MKKILALLLLLIPSTVFAQSTATTTLPGYMGTIGCNAKNSVCYQPSSPPVNSAALEASHVFKASAGTLFGLSVTATSTAGYVLVFNSATAPANGAVTPVACYYIPSAPGTIGIAFTPFPLKMSTGITAVFSTTGCFTSTGSATAFFTGEIL
jgi:hypothetical protein